jgi:hypothetical protein
MKNSISGIITTNYDGFFESVFPDFRVYVSEKDLINSQLYYDGEIYKINGSFNDPKSIVIHSKDYENREKYSKYLASKLLTLFVEYPIIFIGYSINDADLLRILKDLYICLNDEQKKSLRDNLLFIDYTDNPDEQAEGVIEREGIIMNYFKLSKFSLLFNHVAKYVKPGIHVSLLRRIKEMVNSIVLNQENSDNRIVGAELFDSKLKPTDLAILFAGKGSVYFKGYLKVDYNDVLKDVVFDTKAFDSKLIFDNFMKDNPRLSNLVPFHYYLKRYPGTPDLHGKKLLSKIDDIYSPSLLKLVEKKGRKIYKSISDIQKESFKPNKELIEIIINLREISINELETYIKRNFEKFTVSKDSNYKTNFKKLVTAYDYQKYK